MGLGRERGTRKKTPLGRQGAASEGRPASGLVPPCAPRAAPGSGQALGARWTRSRELGAQTLRRQRLGPNCKTEDAKRDEQIVPSAASGHGRAQGFQPPPGCPSPAGPSRAHGPGSWALIAALMLMMIYIYFLNHSSPQFSGLIYSRYW